MFEESEDYIKIVEWPELIKPKPKDRIEALNTLKKLNGKQHSLISSVTIARNGSMVWNYSDRARLTMKNFNIDYFWLWWVILNSIIIWKY